MISEALSSVPLLAHMLLIRRWPLPACVHMGLMSPEDFEAVYGPDFEGVLF